MSIGISQYRISADIGKNRNIGYRFFYKNDIIPEILGKKRQVSLEYEKVFLTSYVIFLSSTLTFGFFIAVF